MSVNLADHVLPKGFERIYCNDCHDVGSLWKTVIAKSPDGGWTHQRSAWPCGCKRGKDRWSEGTANAQAVTRGTLVHNALESLILDHIFVHGTDPLEETLKYAQRMGSNISEIRSIAKQLRGDADEDGSGAVPAAATPEREPDHLGRGDGGAEGYDHSLVGPHRVPQDFGEGH